MSSHKRRLGTSVEQVPADAMNVVLMMTASTAGGVWTHVADLEQRLRAKGHNIVLALDPAAGEVVALAEQRGWAWVNAFGRLPSADVIHIHLHKSMDYRLMGRQLALRIRHPRAAVVVTEHLPRVPATDPQLAYDPTVPAGRRKLGARQVKAVLKGLQLRLAHAIITVSASDARFLARRYRLASSAVTVVHNGVHVPDVWSPTSPGPTLEVVAIGTLTWRKGFDVLIAAVALCEIPIRLTIYGTGDMQALLERQAATVMPEIVFGGWRPDGPDVSSAFDVLCLPSRSEALGYAALEAMARGRAVVGSAVDGIPEVIEAGVTGLLVEPDCPRSLANALTFLALNRKALIEMGCNGRHRVINLFAVDQMIDATERVYRGAVWRTSR